MTSIVYPTTNLRHIEQLNIVRGKGVYVYDDSGNEYLEGLAGLWCASLGYGNVELIEAITSQLKTLSLLSYVWRAHPQCCYTTRRAIKRDTSC